MQVKTRYYPTPQRQALTKNNTNQFWNRGREERRGPHSPLMGISTGPAVLEDSMDIPQKIKN